VLIQRNPSEAISEEDITLTEALNTISKETMNIPGASKTILVGAAATRVVCNGSVLTLTNPWPWPY